MLRAATAKHRLQNDLLCLQKFVLLSAKSRPMHTVGVIALSVIWDRIASPRLPVV